MSKTDLKRELAQLDRDQLQQLLLDLYAGRKEVRPWLDFFVNPDVDALYTAHVDEIMKEARRTRRGSRTKARITQFRKIIRDYEGYGVESAEVLRLMQAVLMIGAATVAVYYDTDTLENGLLKLTADMLAYGDKHLLYDDAVNKVREVIDSETTGNFFRRRLAAVLQSQGIEKTD